PTNLGGDATAGYRYDDRNYAMIIMEDLGMKDGLSLEFMRQTVIENAATGSGVPVSDILIISSVDTVFDEKQASRIIYSTNVDGLDLVYTNTIVSEDHRTAQLITMAIAASHDEKQTELHQKFLNLLRLK
ncbi:MAG: hypothetical protein AAGJ85_06820, partial [Pseudomonadota bacterium]